MPDVTFLELASTIALATLAAITAMLSMKRYVHLAIAVGQEVFKWCTLALAAVLFTRILAIFEAINTPTARIINSLCFSASVIGIIWSVWKHGRTNKY